MNLGGGGKVFFFIFGTEHDAIYLMMPLFHFFDNVRTLENLVVVSEKHENFFSRWLSIAHVHVGAI